MLTFKKSAISLIVVLIMLSAYLNGAQAKLEISKSEFTENSKNVSDLLMKTVNDIKNNENTLQVMNKNGNEIYDPRVRQIIVSMINNKQYNKLQNYLLDNKYSLSYEKNDIVDSSDSIRLLGTGETVIKKLNQYHLEYDKSGKFKKEWMTIMTVGYHLDTGGTLTHSTGPIVDVITDNFGSAFIVNVSRMSSGYDYLSGRRGIKYYTSYNLSATLDQNITIGNFKFLVGDTIDWGRIYVNKTVR